MSVSMLGAWGTHAAAQERLGVEPPQRPGPVEPTFPPEPPPPPLSRPTLPPVPPPSPEERGRLPVPQVFVRRWNGTNAWEEIGLHSASATGISDATVGAGFTGLALTPTGATATAGVPVVAWLDGRVDSRTQVFLRQLFDGVATYQGLQHHWAEGNPILVSWMPYLGAGGTLLLFKAKGARPKDESDLSAVLPRLDHERRALLGGWLDLVHPGHFWLPDVRRGSVSAA